METYKKERSSRHHLRIDAESSLSQDEGGGLFLSNPVACGSISPGGPMTGGSPTSTHPHTIHHLPLRTSPPSSSANNGLTQSLNLSHSSSASTPVSTLTRGGSGERSSFGKGKNRSKSPALLRFFVRGTGGSRKTSEVEEEDYGSSGSDHEDPFSPRSMTAVELPQNGRLSSEGLKSQRSVEHYATLPRQFRRNHSTGSSSVVTQRDSGFSSERESISHLKDDLNSTLIAEDSSSSRSPTEEDYHPAGMEALEVLHNQLQILVKQECDNEETDAVNVYEEVIASLSRQIEDLSNSVDCLRQSDQNLRLSLRLAEQRAMESEIKLRHALDRNQRSEQKYLKLAIKYQALAKKHREAEKVHQRRVLGQRASSDWASNRTPPQRVQSQTQYDRENPPGLDPVAKRPNTAQGFHSDSDKVPPTKPTVVSSLSHTQTSV